MVLRPPGGVCKWKSIFSCKTDFNDYICRTLSGKNAEIAQLVERWLPKPKVAGSSPVFRSDNIRTASMYVCFTSSGSFLFCLLSVLTRDLAEVMFVLM